MNLAHRLALVLLALVPVSAALAQPKPALVKDIDQPARAKYQETISHPTECNSASTCLFNFSAVPAGKRLVVTWVNAFYEMVGAGSDSWAVLFPADPSGIEIYLVPTPNQWASTLRTINSPAVMYVEAGISPSLQIAGLSLLNGGAKATLVGYLVSVP